MELYYILCYHIIVLVLVILPLCLGSVTTTVNSVFVIIISYSHLELLSAVLLG